MYLTIIFIGPEKAGKTKIMDRLHNHPYSDDYRKASIPNFKQLKNNTGDSLEVWDVPGGRRFEQLRESYYERCDLFCYCVDLSTEINIDQIQQEMNQALTNSPRASIILVGTKADGCPENPQEKLNAITLKDIQITKRIVTSAQENIGFTSDQFTKKNNDSLFEVLWTTAKAIWIEKEQAAQIILAKYPQSYHRIWESERGAADTATSLLKDYSKVSNGLSFFESLQSTAKLLVTGHWRRNHHDAVLATLKENHQNIYDILSTLEEKLIEQGKPVNPKGSLAKRINFIQEKIGQQIIDIEELNRTIKENNNEKITCCC